MKVNTSIPLCFEEVQNFDSRFQKVKIWLMHLGKNYNGSIFSKEAVDSALETLKNTPILGYIEESRLGEQDFKGHEVELVVENGEFKTKYIGHAYGVIQESCNPRFEQKEGDNGELLTYLVCDGLLWTKFDDAVSILGEDGEVAQSMELAKDYDGFFDEEGYFNFTRFSFDGACMLGKNIFPAMQKASVEKVFTKSFKQEIDEKIKEFNDSYSHLFEKHNFKEVVGLTLEELLEKYSVTNEQLSEKGINAEDFSIEELEVKIQEAFKSDQDESDQDDENQDEGKEDGEEELDKKEPDGEDQDSSKSEEKFTITFELSQNDIRSQIYNQLDKHITEAGVNDPNNQSDSSYWIVDVFETYLVAEDYEENDFFKVDYEIKNDEVALGGVSKVFPMYLTSEEKGALEMMRSSFEQIKQENEQLKAFQADILKTQHESEVEDLFSQFSKLSSDDVAEIRADMHNYTIEQIEAKLYEMLGRKTATFTKKESGSTKLKLKVDSTNDKPKTGYSHLFAKHGIKN